MSSIDLQSIQPMLILLTNLKGFIRTDATFVMRFLRARKFDAQDAFEVYVNYYRFMHSQRDFFLGYNINNPEVYIIFLDPVT